MQVNISWIDEHGSTLKYHAQLRNVSSVTHWLVESVVDSQTR